MVECAHSASSARILISLSQMFKHISRGSLGMMGTCGSGDVCGHFHDLDDEAISQGLFGGSQGVGLVKDCHLSLDRIGGLDAASMVFQSSIGKVSQSVLTGFDLLSSIGMLTGVSVIIVQVCCHGSVHSFPSILEGMLSMGGSVKL